MRGVVTMRGSVLAATVKMEGPNERPGLPPPKVPRLRANTSVKKYQAMHEAVTVNDEYEDEFEYQAMKHEYQDEYECKAEDIACMRISF